MQLQLCITTMTILSTILTIDINPTNGKYMWHVSNMPPIIPNEPLKPKTGRRQIIRMKELDEGPTGTKSGVCNGKVSKKGIVMHCLICGSTKRNKRFHGKQENDTGHSLKKNAKIVNKHVLNHLCCLKIRFQHLNIHIFILYCFHVLGEKQQKPWIRWCITLHFHPMHSTRKNIPDLVQKNSI